MPYTQDFLLTLDFTFPVSRSASPLFPNPALDRSPSAMSTSPEGSDLQNGTVHEPGLEPKSDPAAGPERAPVPEGSAVTASGDPEPEQTEPSPTSEIQSVEPDNPPAAEEPTRPQLQKDEGSRTFTMRELLNELKTDQNETNSPYRLLLSFAFKFFSGTFTELVFSGSCCYFLIMKE